MSTRPVPHSTWQVLRAAKRLGPATGRSLRLSFTQKTRDGSFLTALVDLGLLTRLSGGQETPFEATYVLTALGEQAAEYGEYEYTRPPRDAGR